MPSVQTASQRGKANRNKGAKTELDLCSYLRPIWPEVDRSVRTGYRTKTRQSRDNGDIKGTPGIIWSVKNWSREYIDQWWAELMEMELAEPIGSMGPIRLLVVKNTGHAWAGDWWCWQPLWQLATHYSGVDLGGSEWLCGGDLVRTKLSTVITVLRGAGYGLPLGEQVPA